jgi:hypothetical protein
VRLVAHFNLLHVWLDGAHFCGSATSFMQTSGRGCVSWLCVVFVLRNHSIKPVYTTWYIEYTIAIVYLRGCGEASPLRQRQVLSTHLSLHRS